MEIDTIYNMDCLEGMKMIPDGSVDCIICDLPYGTTHCAWDAIIPFDKLWEQYHRICKPEGAIVLFGSEPFSTMIRMSNMKEFRYDWIWKKTKAADFLNAKARPLKNHEIVSVFCQNGSTSMVYNPQGLRKVNKVCKNGDGKFGNSQGDWNHKASYVQEYENYPMTVQEFANESNTFHPTQKPVNLLRYLIATYSNEGDTILDNCMAAARPP